MKWEIVHSRQLAPNFLDQWRREAQALIERAEQ